MPIFKSLDQDKVNELTARSSGSGKSVMDLTEYVDYIKSAKADLDAGHTYGGGGYDLEAGDNVRAIKRRTTLAAKQVGVFLKWKTKTANKLEFLLTHTAPAKRTRRPNVATTNGAPEPEPAADAPAPRTARSRRAK